MTEDYPEDWNRADAAADYIDDEFDEEHVEAARVPGSAKLEIVLKDSQGYIDPENTDELAAFGFTFKQAYFSETGGVELVFWLEDEEDDDE